MAAYWTNSSLERIPGCIQVTASVPQYDEQIKKLTKDAEAATLQANTTSGHLCSLQKQVKNLAERTQEVEAGHRLLFGRTEKLENDITPLESTKSLAGFHDAEIRALLKRIKELEERTQHVKTGEIKPHYVFCWSCVAKVCKICQREMRQIGNVNCSPHGDHGNCKICEKPKP